MDKEKIKRVGQLVLDVITAVWLVILTFLGSSCVSAGGNVNQEVKTDIEFQYPDNIQPPFDVESDTTVDFLTLPDVSGDLLSFIIKE